MFLYYTLLLLTTITIFKLINYSKLLFGIKLKILFYSIPHYIIGVH